MPKPAKKEPPKPYLSKSHPSKSDPPKPYPSKPYKDISMAELRELCKKDYYSWFSVLMHHSLLYVTRIILKTNITPNQITAFWVFLQLFASFLMVFGTYKFNVIGVLLYTSAALLDYIDGQLARIKKIRSYRGIFLEELGLYFGGPIFFLCLSLGTSLAYDDYLYLILGLVAAFSILYSQLAITDPFYYAKDMRKKVLIIKEKLSTRPKSQKLINLFLIFRRSNPLNLMTLLILVNLPQWAIFVYTPIYLLKMLRVIYVQLKMLGRFDKGMKLKIKKS